MERTSKEMSEAGDHLLFNPGHMVDWEILTNVSKQVNKWKIPEAFYARTLQSTVNSQLNSKRTLLLWNRITWFSHEWLIFTWFLNGFLMCI